MSIGSAKALKQSFSHPQSTQKSHQLTSPCYNTTACMQI